MTGQIVKDTNSTLDIVPLSYAEACITAYKQKMYAMNVPHEDILKAYLLKTRDLFEALGVSGSEAPELNHPFVRIYLGLEPESSPNIYKLFIVPVTLEGKDEIPKGLINPEDEVERNYVYDFNTPCPKTCDRESALFKAGIVI